MSNPVATFDFTLPESKNFVDDIISWCRQWCKKWCFQLEMGENKHYLHFQGRISLKYKKRKLQLAKELKEDGRLTGHISETSSINRRNFFYVTKEETRMEGPWCDDETKLVIAADYIPRQVREMGPLRPFQQHVVDSVNDWDTRTINVILDQQGNNGKTLLKGYLRAHKLARPLPYSNDYKDMMRMVCGMPTSKCYIIDMPRALTKNNLQQCYAAVETIKDGYAYDDRYKFREKYFDCPIIWVLSNKIPDIRYLTQDRWKFWRISSEYKLKGVRPDQYKLYQHDDLENMNRYSDFSVKRIEQPIIEEIELHSHIIHECEKDPSARDDTSIKG